jgi:hypothetical protein
MAPRPGIAALLCAAALSSHAAVVPIAGDGAWNTFNVDDLDALSFGVEWISNDNSLSPDFGTPLSFTFTIGAGTTGTLTVVDAGFAGDTFRVTNFDHLLGTTSSVPAQSFVDAPNAGTDFASALADPRFSRGVFQLDPGSYRISGSLLQSVPDGEFPLNATVGAVRLAVAPVPEPGTLASLAAGLGVLVVVARRRSR